MIPWKGPAVALAVFVALVRVGPESAECPVQERLVPPPPPPARTSTGWVRQGPEAGSAPSAPDPFALAAAPVAAAQAGPGPRASGPAPARPWQVTGLVGRRAAVLVRSDGSSVVVSVGQSLDSARVVAISSAGVELEDRGGRFLLKVR